MIKGHLIVLKPLPLNEPRYDATKQFVVMGLGKLH